MYLGLRANPRRTADTVIVRYPIGSAGSGSNLTQGAAGQELAQRHLFSLPAHALRWRLRIGNWNAFNNQHQPGGFTVNNVFLGRPSFAQDLPMNWNAATGLPWNFRLDRPADKVFGPMVVPADGSDLVTNWVRAQRLCPRAHVIYALSLGFAGVTNVPMISNTHTGGLWGRGGGTFAGISSDAQVGAMHVPNNFMASNGGTVFDIRLEVEMPWMPVVVGIGDSIMEGSTHDYGGAYQHEVWFGQAGQRYGFAAVNLGISSSTAAQWAADPASAWRYQRIDWSNVDKVVMQIGRNDLANNTPWTTVAGYRQSIWSLVDSLQPNVDKVDCTYFPFQAVTAAAHNMPAGDYELQRQAANAAIGAGLPGVAKVCDLDRVINPPGTPLASDGEVFGDPRYMNSDPAHPDPHPTRLAQSMMAAALGDCVAAL